MPASACVDQSLVVVWKTTAAVNCLSRARAASASESSSRSGGAARSPWGPRPAIGTEELERILAAQVAPARAEPGCVAYHFHRDAKDPCVFVFYENFESQEALEQHLKLPHLLPLMNRLDELLAGPVEIRHLDMLSNYG